MKNHFFHIQRLFDNNKEWFVDDEIIVSENEFNNFYKDLLNKIGVTITQNNYDKVGLLKHIDSDLKEHLESNYAESQINQKYSYLKNSFNELMGIAKVQLNPLQCLKILNRISNKDLDLN